MFMKIYFYGLADPRNPNVIRFVGKTNAPRVRHIDHCTDAGATDKCAWVETLRIDGILPQMIILAECQNDAAAMGKERELIAKYNASEADSFMQICKTDLLLVNANNHTGRLLVLDALTKARGKIAVAARMLGICRPTLYERIQRYKIKTAAVVRAKTGLKAKARLDLAKHNNHSEIVADMNSNKAACWLNRATQPREQFRL